MMANDLTLSEDSLYGSIGWAAQTFGMSKDMFFKKRTAMLNEGFPVIDPLTKRYIKADVVAWIDQRRRVGAITVRTEITVNEGVKIDAL